MFALRSQYRAVLCAPPLRLILRSVSTLPENPDIYVHPGPNNTYTLTYLPSANTLPLGTTTTLPPTPKTFTENPLFLPLLQRVVRVNAANDPLVESDALTFASPAGASLFNTATKRRARMEAGIGGANYQGGAGGGGVGGWVHVYDQRGVPAFGRIADTEDIIGSLFVDANGKIVDKEKGGKWEENRMYRLLTGERGLCRLSGYLRDKVREALKEEGGKV